jgi:hypothetical protein
MAGHRGRITGLHPTLLPVLAERQIVALGSDGNNDTAPSAAASGRRGVSSTWVVPGGMPATSYRENLQFLYISARAGLPGLPRVPRRRRIRERTLCEGSAKPT